MKSCKTILLNSHSKCFWFFLETIFLRAVEIEASVQNQDIKSLILPLFMDEVELLGNLHYLHFHNGLSD
jgi:hypothetical protein